MIVTGGLYVLQKAKLQSKESKVSRPRAGAIIVLGKTRLGRAWQHMGNNDVTYELCTSVNTWTH